MPRNPPKPNRDFCGRTRREFLWQAGGGFGAVALSGLLGPDVLQGQLSDITSSLGLDSIDVSAQLDMAGELLGGVGEGVGDIVGGATDGVGGLLEGAGGLLGGDEDEEGDGDAEEGGLLDGARGLLGGNE